MNEAENIDLYANKLLQDVQCLIEEALPSGIPGMKHIGTYLGVSNQTLQRRLAEQGLNFRDLAQHT